MGSTNQKERRIEPKQSLQLGVETKIGFHLISQNGVGTLAFLEAWTSPRATQPSRRASKHLARATLHLAQSESTPRAEQANTSRRATLNLAQSKSTPRAEQGGARTPPSRCASHLLAQREVKMNLKKGLAFFFSDVEELDLTTFLVQATLWGSFCPSLLLLLF